MLVSGGQGLRLLPDDGIGECSGDAPIRKVASLSCFKAVFNLALTNDMLNGMLSVMATWPSYLNFNS